MKKWYSVFVLLFLFLVAGNGFSQTENISKDSIDLTMEHCLDTAFGTYGAIMCIENATSDWDNELNRVYQQLMKTLTPEQQELLKTSQRAWIQYRDQELTFVAAYYDRQGSGWGYTRAERELELIRTRTLELNRYLGN